MEEEIRETIKIGEINSLATEKAMRRLYSNDQLLLSSSAIFSRLFSKETLVAAIVTNDSVIEVIKRDREAVLRAVKLINHCLENYDEDFLRSTSSSFSISMVSVRQNILSSIVSMVAAKSKLDGSILTEIEKSKVKVLGKLVKLIWTNNDRIFSSVCFVVAWSVLMIINTERIAVNELKSVNPRRANEIKNEFSTNSIALAERIDVDKMVLSTSTTSTIFFAIVKTFIYNSVIGCDVRELLNYDLNSSKGNFKGHDYIRINNDDEGWYLLIKQSTSEIDDYIISPTMSSKAEAKLIVMIGKIVLKSQWMTGKNQIIVAQELIQLESKITFRRVILLSTMECLKICKQSEKGLSEIMLLESTELFEMVSVMRYMIDSKRLSLRHHANASIKKLELIKNAFGDNGHWSSSDLMEALLLTSGTKLITDAATQKIVREGKSELFKLAGYGMGLKFRKHSGTNTSFRYAVGAVMLSEMIMNIFDEDETIRGLHIIFRWEGFKSYEILTTILLNKYHTITFYDDNEVMRIEVWHKVSATSGGDRLKIDTYPVKGKNGGLEQALELTGVSMDKGKRSVITLITGGLVDENIDPKQILKIHEDNESKVAEFISKSKSVDIRWVDEIYMDNSFQEDFLNEEFCQRKLNIYAKVQDRCFDACLLKSPTDKIDTRRFYMAFVTNGKNNEALTNKRENLLLASFTLVNNSCQIINRRKEICDKIIAILNEFEGKEKMEAMVSMFNMSVGEVLAQNDGIGQRHLLLIDQMPHRHIIELNNSITDSEEVMSEEIKVKLTSKRHLDLDGDM